MLRRHAVWPNERTHVSASPRWWLGRLRSISAPVCALATTTLAPSASLSLSLGASWALRVARRGRVRLFVACNAMYVVIEVIMGKAANDPWLESTARRDSRGPGRDSLVSTLSRCLCAQPSGWPGPSSRLLILSRSLAQSSRLSHSGNFRNWHSENNCKSGGFNSYS